MVQVKKDLTGMRFGRLVVIKQEEDKVRSNGKKYAQWLCVCDCDPNKTCIVQGDSLNSGRVNSCGCLFTETLIKTGRNNKKYNNYDISGDIGIGWTSNTNKEFYFDLDDYDKIKDYCWLEIERSDRSYGELKAKIIDKGYEKTMAQFLTGENYIDHIDRNPLNNQRSNFRKSNPSTNAMNHKKSSNNTSGIIGVQWHKKNQKWTVFINIDKKKTYLGSFINKYDAIRERLNAENKYYGEFAPQRHLFEEYNILPKKIKKEDDEL